jgi:hypothetical protein
MPIIHTLIGAKNMGKTTVLVKLYEMILRVYDNYEIYVKKIPINTQGDFLGEITIHLGKVQIKHKNELKECPSLKNKEKRDKIKILFHTAGDAVENFDILNKKINDDQDYLSNFHLIFCCLKVKEENQCIDVLNKLESTDFIADGQGSRDTISKLTNAAILHNCIFGLNKNLDQLPIKLISIVDLEVKKLY